MSKQAIEVLQEIVTSEHETAHDRAWAADILLEHHDARRDRCVRSCTHLAWMALVVTLACLAMCCAHAKPLTRTVAEAHDASVQITISCVNGSGYGSGVIMSSRTVLTANHVANKAANCLYLAETADGKKFVMMISKEWPEHDITELYTPFALELVHDGHTQGLLPSTPIELAPVPPPGELACIVSSFPDHLRRCGAVQYYRQEPPGDVEIDVLVEPGNSGSGVYDLKGRLVGITTHLRRCQNGQWCGGRFSSLEFLLSVKP